MSIRDYVFNVTLILIINCMIKNIKSIIMWDSSPGDILTKTLKKQPQYKGKKKSKEIHYGYYTLESRIPCHSLISIRVRHCCCTKSARERLVHFSMDGNVSDKTYHPWTSRVSKCYRGCHGWHGVLSPCIIPIIILGNFVIISVI